MATAKTQPDRHRSNRTVRISATTRYVLSQIKDGFGIPYTVAVERAVAAYLSGLQHATAKGGGK